MSAVMSRIPVFSRQLSGHLIPSQTDEPECTETVTEHRLVNGHHTKDSTDSDEQVNGGFLFEDNFTDSLTNSGTEDLPQCNGIHEDDIDIKQQNNTGNNVYNEENNVDKLTNGVTKDLVRRTQTSRIAKPPSRLPITPRAPDTSQKRTLVSPGRTSGIPTLGSFSPNKFVENLKIEKRNGFHVNGDLGVDRLDGNGLNDDVDHEEENHLSNGGSVCQPEIKPPASPTKRRVPITASHNVGGMLSRNHKPHYCTHNKDQQAGAPTRSNLTRSSSTSSLNQNKPPARSNVSSTLNSTATGRPASSRPNITSTVPKPAGKSKRPAWDLKGRLQDMEQILATRDQISISLKGQLENNDERIKLLESQNSQLSGTVAQKEEITSAISQEVGTLQKKLRDTEDELDSTRRKYQRELDEISRESKEKQDSINRKYERELEDLNFKISSLERQKESLESELKACHEEISGLKSAVSKYTAAQAGLRSELEATQVSLDSSVKDGRLKDEEIRQLRETVANQQQTLEEASQKMREQETLRRKLHNSIQELKGNIRVFCRVRPLLNEEKVTNDGVIQHMSYPDPDGKVLELDKLAEVNPNESIATSLRRGTNKYEFSFDRVFQPNTNQAEVFEEISQLVQSALDGYNVCIFAYGQTGSGKTYTMEGPNEITEESQGMIPRAVVQIFETARKLQEKGWEYEFTASFLEIYNETIRDLLGDKSDMKHEIKKSGSGSNDVMVTDLTLVPVKSEIQVHKLLKKAGENRAVAETKCNERSSRSHSVFQLKLTGSNELTGETSQGLLSLVDLAGSERLKESGSEGQRLKEAKCINKSLSNLGNVIMARANKESFVPYRNSKLTYLLQNSLGGNSKTLMFVNVSPKEECFQETVCSLRFATQVNQCNIGTAQKKVK